MNRTLAWVILALAAVASPAGPPARPLPGDAWNDPLTGILFRYCPPGTFEMGTPEEGPYQVPDQKPRHAVTLSQGFWLGQWEVTVAQWEGRGVPEPGSAGLETKTMVSWEDCQAFLQGLNTRAGAPFYRLPTEAEWEYACTAGTPALPYFGPGSEGYGVSYHGIGSGEAPHPWGLENLLGNTREWCSDWGGPYPGETVTDPQGPPAGRYRVNRGGHGSLPYRHNHPTWRWYYTPDFRDNDLGFRLVRLAE